MMLLGVNIDHVASVRQARQASEPDPVHAAVLAELGGADQITVHLREDRRHIQDRDVRLLREVVGTHLNLELGLDEGVLAIACEVRPHQVCLVPERREELTTEGGLDVAARLDEVTKAVEALHEAGVTVAAFIEPDAQAVEAAQKAGCEAIELHTGRYANAETLPDMRAALTELEAAARAAHEAGLRPNLGHGVNYQNVTRLVRRLPWAHEINIGHSIIARAFAVGLAEAVREMKELVRHAVEEADRLTLIHRLPS